MNKPNFTANEAATTDEHGLLGIEGKAAFAKHCSVLSEHVDESKWPIVEDSIVALGVALQNRSAVFAALVQHQANAALSTSAAKSADPTQNPSSD